MMNKFLCVLFFNVFICLLCASAQDSEEYSYVAEQCCLVGAEFAKNSDKSDCSVAKVPDDVEPEDVETCQKSIKSCCQNHYKEKEECTTGIGFAKSRQCTKPETEIGRNCCDECSLGIWTGQTQGKSNCGGPPSNDVSPSTALKRTAYLKCCEEAAREAATTTPKIETTTKKKVTPKPDICKKNNPCEQICVSEAGKAVCKCNKGFKLADDKKNCKDINECAGLDDLCTEDNTVCHNTPGSYKCVPLKKRDVGLSCPPGFKRNVINHVCDDINECQLPRPPCPKYLCENTIGGFKCGGKPGTPATEPTGFPSPPAVDTEPNKGDMCPPGFRAGADDECVDIDECAERLDDCQRLSQNCFNSHGSFFCQDHGSKRCAPGFKFIPTTGTCEDINECEEDNEICRQGEVCINLPGAYDCKSKISTFPKLTPKSCGEGTRQRPGSTSCEDIDECRENLHLCDEFQNCINTYGGHECRCKNGFELDHNSGSCVDIDECTMKLDNCPPGQHCINTLGAFTCSKQKLYTSVSTTSSTLPPYEYEYYDSEEEVETENSTTPKTIPKASYPTPNTPRPGYNKPNNHRPEEPKRPESPRRPDPRHPEDSTRPDSPRHPEDTTRPVYSRRPEYTRRPEETMRHESPSQPTSGSEYPSRPEPPRRPDEPRRSESPSLPEEPRHPEHSSRPEPPRRSEEPRRPDIYSRPEEPRHPEHPSRPEPPRRTEEPRRPDIYSRPEEPRQPEYPRRPEPPRHPQEPRQPETLSRPEEPRHPEYPRRPEPPRHPEEPRQPETLSRPEEPRHPEYPRRQHPPSPPEVPRPSEFPSRSEHPRRPDSSRPEYHIGPEEPRQPEYPGPPDYSTRQESPRHPEEPRSETPRRSEEPRRPETSRRPEQPTPEEPRWSEPPTTRPEDTTSRTDFSPPDYRNTITVDKDRDGSISIDTNDIPKNNWTDVVGKDKDPYDVNRMHCFDGYEPNENGQCVDIDECKEGKQICNTEEVCVNREGGYICECGTGLKRDESGWCKPITTTSSTTTTSRPTTTPRVTTAATPRYSYPEWSTPHTNRPEPTTHCDFGYTFNRDTYRCVDIDECENGKASCSSDERCVNTRGGYKCVCSRDCGRSNNNYSPNHRRPTTYAEPRITVGSVYGQKGTRYTRPSFTRVNAGTIQASCPWGYSYTDDRKCVDIDECSTNESECGPQQTCENFFGGYSCKCPMGYKKVGKNDCEDIDECTASMPCSQYSECVNTIGSYKCRCGEGFKNSPNNDKVCIDLDECERPGICEQECINVWGSHRCSCKQGFKLRSDNRTCEDVDECAEWKATGRPGRLCYGDCINVPGSYRCDCPKGYRVSADDRNCIDINECETGEATCARSNKPGEVCQNTRGGYHCHTINCPEGYRLENKKCSRIVRKCQYNDWNCLQQPSAYTYNFITIVSKIYLPSSSVDLFTMHGPSWVNSVINFELKLIDVQAGRGVKPADLNCFDMRPTRNVCMVSLLCSLAGPQVVELELTMSLYQHGQFAGKAVARLVVIVSEYEF